MTEDRAAVVEARVNAVRDLLHDRRADGILLDSRHDFAWLTLGGQNHILLASETGVAPILITRDDAVVLAPINEYDRIADEELAGLPLRIEKTPWWPTDQPATAIRAADVADELESLRTALLPVEHDRLDWLGRVVTETCDAALRNVEPGRTTEDDIVADTMSAFARQGVRLPVVLIAADDRIDRYRHPLTSGRTVERRVMLIVCAERWGLIVAHTQFAELAPMTADQQTAADATAHVLATMREATVPGHTFGDVLVAAQRAYAEVDMPNQWQLHHQGGSIGYRARERVATPTDTTPIRPGMAFAWNPSVVGYKREETLYLDANAGQHIVTTTPE